MNLEKAKELLIVAESRKLNLMEFAQELMQVASLEIAREVITKEVVKSTNIIQEIIDKRLVGEKRLSSDKDTECVYKGSDVTKITEELLNIKDSIDFYQEKNSNFKFNKFDNSSNSEKIKLI